MRNLSDRSKNLILSITSVLFVLGMLEILLRLLYGNHPVFLYPQAIHVYTEYGYKLKPNQTGTYTLDKPVRTNSVGFRDQAWRLPKPPDHTRVMVLGDSLTFGNAVRAEDTYPKVLERQLRTERRNIEVLSAAVQGWSTYHYARFFEKEGIAYDPNIVIIGFYITTLAALRPSRRRRI